jgi:hypothetical protein
VTKKKNRARNDAVVKNGEKRAASVLRTRNVATAKETRMGRRDITVQSQQKIAESARGKKRSADEARKSSLEMKLPRL